MLYHINLDQPSILVRFRLDLLVSENKSTDDDFLWRVVLVLLGTVLAPMHLKIVPKQYYALVVDVPRMNRINWNVFTLSVLLDCLRIVRKGKHLRQWPKGNLALMQVYTYTIFFLKRLIIYAIAYTNHNSSCPCSSCIGRDRKSTRLNSSHSGESRMPSSA